MERTWDMKNKLDVEERLTNIIKSFLNIIFIGGFFLLMGWIGTHFI
jgi:hypothetical protein